MLVHLIAQEYPTRVFEVTAAARLRTTDFVATRGCFSDWDEEVELFLANSYATTSPVLSGKDPQHRSDTVAHTFPAPELAPGYVADQEAVYARLVHTLVEAEDPPISPIPESKSPSAGSLLAAGRRTLRG